MQKLIQIFVDKLAIDPSQLKYEATFDNDLNIDSLDLYELFLSVEKEFQVTIPDEESEKIFTVGALIDYLDKHTVN
jgi:acyl carrier protein